VEEIMTREERKAKARKDLWKVAALIVGLALLYVVGPVITGVLGFDAPHQITKGDCWLAWLAFFFILYRLEFLSRTLDEIKTSVENMEE
jgi:hypothetical protein